MRSRAIPINYNDSPVARGHNNGFSSARSRFNHLLIVNRTIFKNLGCDLSIELEFLVVHRIVVRLDEDEGDASGNSAVPGSPSNSSPQQLSSAQVSYSVSIEIGFSPTVKQQLLASVLFLKRALVVEAEKSVASQLRVMTLDDPAATPYETLHNYVSNAVAPYFKSYIRATGKTEYVTLIASMISESFGIYY